MIGNCSGNVCNFVSNASLFMTDFDEMLRLKSDEKVSRIFTTYFLVLIISRLSYTLISETSHFLTDSRGMAKKYV